MTIIRPTKNHIMLNRALVFVITALVIAAGSLVALYNRTVNTGHEIEETKSEIAAIQTEIAELHDALFAVFDSERVEELSAIRGLVSESSPRYVERTIP